MEQTLVTLNKKGFTLLEAMIAMVLLGAITLWTMQSMITAYNFTSRNQIRDEAIKLSAETLTDLRNTPFSAHSLGNMGVLNITRQIRNYAQSYTVNRTITSQVAGTAYSADVIVNWTYKGTNYSYTATTILADK